MPSCLQFPRCPTSCRPRTTRPAQWDRRCRGSRARSRYRYYIRVTSLPERFYIGGTFSLGFELWRYTAPNSWALESTSNAKMMRMPAPAGYPSPADYAEGDVRNAAGSLVGRLTMG